MREYPELIKECGVTPCKLIKNDSSYVGVKSGREATGVFCLCVWAEIWLNKLLDLSCIISYRKSYHSTEEMEAVIARSVFLAWYVRRTKTDRWRRVQLKQGIG